VVRVTHSPWRRNPRGGSNVLGTWRHADLIVRRARRFRKAPSAAFGRRSWRPACRFWDDVVPWADVRALKPATAWAKRGSTARPLCRTSLARLLDAHVGTADAESVVTEALETVEVECKRMCR
jgi:hypothetical protein